MQRTKPTNNSPTAAIETKADSSVHWRFLEHLAVPSERQMAIDSELLSQCERSPNTAYVRFYRMTPPAVTIGCHQQWRSVVDPVQCNRRGWEWARRPTGGGALLHHHEINYAFVIGESALNQRDFFGVFRWVVGMLAEALQSIDIPVTVFGGDDPRTTKSSQHGLCGRSLTRMELESEGKKLAAAAQRIGRGAILQHGTLYLTAPGPKEQFWPVLDGQCSMPFAEQRWGAVPHRFTELGWTSLAETLKAHLAQQLGANAEPWTPQSAFWRRVTARVDEWHQSGWRSRR